MHLMCDSFLSPINIRYVSLLCLFVAGLDVRVQAEAIHRLQYDGLHREYLVYTPSTVEQRDLPLVMTLHGYSSTASGMAHYYGLARHAEQHRYILVIPQSSTFPANDSDEHVTSWNDLAANVEQDPDVPHCLPDHRVYPAPPANCGEMSRCAWTACADDSGFLQQVLDEVLARHRVDSSRIYLLGISNGGMMAMRLACDKPWRFSAVASVIAQLAPGHACGPGSKLPLLHLIGGRDDTVRADGLPGSDGYIYSSAAETATTWARSLGCAAQAKPWQTKLSRSMGLECSAYKDCPEISTGVISCADSKEGHDWPGQRAGPSASCVTAIQKDSGLKRPTCSGEQYTVRDQGMNLVWEFFNANRRTTSVTRPLTLRSGQ
ncbi:MAG: alpha/beta hydrolase family esterase [Pseudomonadales bacterium]